MIDRLLVHSMAATIGDQQVAIHAGSAGIMVFKRLTVSHWARIGEEVPLYGLCKIWYHSFRSSMTLQEFLDSSL